MTPSSLDDSAECNTEDMAASPSSPALPSSPESPSSLEISPPSPQPIVEHDGSDAVGDAVDDSDATSAVVVSDEDFSPEDDDVIVKKKVETGENEVGTNSVSHTFCWEEEKDREVERECHDSAYPDRWGTIVPTGAESMPLDDDGEDLVQSPELVEISPHHDRLESEGTLPQSERTVGLLGAEATVEKTVGRDGDGVASNNDGQNEQSIEGESVKNFEKNHKQEEEEIDQDSQGENRGKNMVDLPIVELASPLKDVDDLAAEPEIMLHQNLTDDRSNGNVFLQVSSHEKSKDNDDDDGSKDRRDNEVMEANLDSAVVSKDYNNNDILLPSSLSENTRFENEMVEINTEVEEATVTAPQLVSPLPDSGDAILKIEEKGKDRNTKDIIHQKSMKKDSQMMRKKDLMELEPDDEVIAAEITNNPDQDKEVAEKEQIEKEGESEMIRTMTASQQQIDNPSESTIQEHEEIEEEIFNKNIMINPVKEINFLNFQDNSSFSTQQGNENDNSNDVSKNEVSNKTSNENYDRNDCDDEEYEQDDNCSLEDADDAGKDDDTDSDDDEEPEPILYYHVHRPTINSSIVCHGPHHLFAYVESNDREKRPDGNSSKTATGVQNVCITQLLSVQMPPSSVAANDQSKDSKNPPRTDAITLCLPSLLEPPQVQPHHQKPLPSPDSSDIDSFEITALSFHYPSATLLSACASDGRGCLYRLSLLTSPVHCPRSRYGPVMGAYHPLLNSAASCTSVTRFDLNTSTLRGPRGGVTCSALDPSSDGMGREGGGQSPQDDVGLAVGYGDGTLALHRIMEERIGLRWRPWSRLESFAEKSVSSEAERRLGRLKFTVVLWSGGAEGAATPDAASRAVTGIMWTGSVLAFSSCTSVKVIDPSTGARLARVERPSGATPGLHHLSMQMQLKIPRMVWEGDPDNDGCSGGLWIAWGHTVACVRRDGKTAEAFEVDGVACGAVPFDKGHMAVLAQMAVWEDTGSPVTMGEDSKDNSKREVVIQTRMLLVDRRTGEPISSDVLPLDVSADSNRHHQRVVLTSSYVAAYRRQGESTIEDSHDLVETLALPSAHDGRGSDPAGHWNAVLTLRLDGRGKEMLPSPLSESDEGVDDAKMNDDDPTQYDAYLRPSIPLPLMTISVPGFPTVVVRVRDVDDAVAYSFQFGRPREAVERALRGRRALRSTTFEQVVEEYLDTLVQSNCSRKKGAQRVHEAAAATEILLGNDNDVWERWVKIFGKVKGGMVALWPYMPVRDPKLPPKVYEIALKHMFNDTLEILACESGKFTNPLIARAAKDQLLNAIRSWGPTASLVEYIHYVRWQQIITLNEDDEDNPIEAIKSPNTVIIDAKRFLKRRYTQTIPSFLCCQRYNSKKMEEKKPKMPPPSDRTDLDSLFDLSKFSDHLLSIAGSDPDLDAAVDTPPPSLVLEAAAELYRTNGEYSRAIRAYLLLGFHSMPPVDAETGRMERPGTRSSTVVQTAPYRHVLSMIEHRMLHRCVLGNRSCFDKRPPYLLSGSQNAATDKTSGEKEEDVESTTGPSKFSPVVGLIRLVGTRAAADFFVSNCGPPMGLGAVGKTLDPDDDTQDGHFLPINVVTKLLEGRPKLQLWFLELIAEQREDIYRMHYTANNFLLHLLHYDLLLKHFEPSKAGIDTPSPLMSFLKTTMPLGGIRPTIARERLGKEKSPCNKKKHRFPQELAFVIERYGDDDMDTEIILKIYLEEMNSVPLALSYALSHPSKSAKLWNMLIAWALRRRNPTRLGSLIELSGLYGADLALLIRKMPPNTPVDDCRRRLMTTLGEYRVRVRMYESTAAVADGDHVAYLGRLARLSRRGHRFDCSRGGEEIGVGGKHCINSKVLKESSPAYDQENENSFVESRQYLLRQSPVARLKPTAQTLLSKVAVAWTTNKDPFNDPVSSFVTNPFNDSNPFNDTKALNGTRTLNDTKTLDTKNPFNDMNPFND